jgi:hypothetical protein
MCVPCDQFHYVFSYSPFLNVRFKKNVEYFFQLLTSINGLQLKALRFWSLGTHILYEMVYNHRHLFHSKNISPSSSLLQGKHLPFTPSPLRLNMFRLFVILSLTQLHRYTPEIFLFSTVTFKYKYRYPLRRIGQEYSAKVAFSIF